MFNSTIYIKHPDENTDVIIFGKSPEIMIEDHKQGISRVGGVWRSPSYLHSYLRSADILINQGMLEDCLDDIGLPLFYIQRHTAELLIKRLLYWVYEIAKLNHEIGKDYYGIPSTNQLERFLRSHDLFQLLEDLKSSSKTFGFRDLPIELSELVRTIKKFETTETFSRYSQSVSKKGMIINHVRTEVALPLIELQKLLKNAISKIIYKLESEDAYENALYDEWLGRARETGRAG